MPNKDHWRRSPELGRRGLAVAAQACTVIGWGQPRGQRAFGVNTAVELKTGQLRAVSRPLLRSWEVQPHCCSTCFILMRTPEESLFLWLFTRG